MSPNHLAARDDAQTPTGGVVVAADTTEVSAGSSAWPDRRLDAARIHRRLRDTP
jgi:hypothetical protein